MVDQVVVLAVQVEVVLEQLAHPQAVLRQLQTQVAVAVVAPMVLVEQVDREQLLFVMVDPNKQAAVR